MYPRVSKYCSIPLKSCVILVVGVGGDSIRSARSGVDNPSDSWVRSIISIL